MLDHALDQGSVEIVSARGACRTYDGSVAWGQYRCVEARSPNHDQRLGRSTSSCRFTGDARATVLEDVACRSRRALVGKTARWFRLARDHRRDGDARVSRLPRPAGGRRRLTPPPACAVSDKARTPAGWSMPVELESAGQQHDQQHDDDQADDAAGEVAPAAAVRPSRKRPDQSEYEHDEKNGSDGHDDVFREGLLRLTVTPAAGRNMNATPPRR